jgi:hypothetical protein
MKWDNYVTEKTMLHQSAIHVRFYKPGAGLYE